ncbi:hypothetical protein HY524_01105 [Candidatus Berkelbacteria bacterium]|nr:hypothetical protein [Candidatus Berkelbacteria bacterium]
MGPEHDYLSSEGGQQDQSNQLSEEIGQALPNESTSETSSVVVTVPTEPVIANFEDQTTLTVMVALSGENRAAVNICLKIFKIDNGLSTSTAIFYHLNSLGIMGENLYLLYVKLCKSQIENLASLLDGVDLNLLSKQQLFVALEEARQNQPFSQFNLQDLKIDILQAHIDSNADVRA